MIRVLVCYGTPEDPEAFQRHYFDVHVPLVWKMPGLRDYTVSSGDVVSTADGGPYLIASLAWDSADDLAADMGSPEGAAVTADVENFATGGWWLWQYEEQPTDADRSAG